MGGDWLGGGQGKEERREGGPRSPVGEQGALYKWEGKGLRPQLPSHNRLSPRPSAAASCCLFR